MWWLRMCWAGSQPLNILHARGCSMLLKMLIHAGVSTFAIVTHIGSIQSGQVVLPSMGL